MKSKGLLTKRTTQTTTRERGEMKADGRRSLPTECCQSASGSDAWATSSGSSNGLAFGETEHRRCGWATTFGSLTLNDRRRRCGKQSRLMAGRVLLIGKLVSER